ELPLPPTVTFNDTITYENFDQGMGGQIIEAAAKGELKDLAGELGQIAIRPQLFEVRCALGLGQQRLERFLAAFALAGVVV
ncbi:MAG: hypothetical protein ACPH51_05240, partial [Luminiphilus sp.]